MLKKVFSAVVNLAVFLACAAIVFQVYSNYTRQPKRPESQNIGDIIRIPGIDFSMHKHTLIAILRDGCTHCAKQMLFYKALASRQDPQNTNFQFIAGVLADASAGRAYLDHEGLAISMISDAQKHFKFPGTPTLIALDSGGKVEKVWVGELNAVRQKEVYCFLFPEIQE